MPPGGLTNPKWAGCRWVDVGAGKSHQPAAEWCADGEFLVQLDLDGPGGLSAQDAPVIGQARCCGIGR